MTSRRFASFAWGALALNVLVILWGAYVRATGSGAGCGGHWPLCNGQVLPLAPRLETLIEFAHRVTSGLSLVVIVVLILWGFRLYGKGAPIRTSLVFAGIFIMVEALVGAGLVLFGLTADNDSIARAVVMAVHLVNTFLLLAALALTAWWASGWGPVRVRGQGWVGAGWMVAALATLVVGMSGAVTALGDTLFPSGSLAEGFALDFSPTAHVLLRMRILHPTIAVGAGLFAVILAQIIKARRPGERTARLATLQVVIFTVQLVAGAFNVALLAPVWMQMVHLLLACSVWLTLVFLGASAFAADAREAVTT